MQGTDEGERLTVTIDAAARVVDLQVLDETRLRLIEDLRGALTDAYRERAVASMRASGSFDDFVERAEKRRRNGWKLNVPAPPDVSRDAVLGRALRGELRPPSEFAFAEPSTGVSANGYLSVQVGASGEPATVEADELWLAGARADTLAAALTEAIRSTREGA